jgi:hypothetical protein
MPGNSLNSIFLLAGFGTSTYFVVGTHAHMLLSS